jgi:hypothetical protein
MYSNLSGINIDQISEELDVNDLKEKIAVI